ncbi:MAG: hypothetical protein ACLUTU_07545 [Blautia faecis]
MRHLIDPLDFALEETTKVLDLADRIAVSPEVWQPCGRWEKDCHSFYEPSTRTRLSFESAMPSLGGKSPLALQVLNSPVPQRSKRSSRDTARVVRRHADIIAMCGIPREGAPLRASMYAHTVPVINAGDGGHNHPTQS